MSLKCETCNNLFSTKSNLNKHCKGIHGITPPTTGFVFNYKCLELECQFVFKCNTDLIRHLKDEHNLDIAFQEINFNNIEDFFTWKSETEKEEKCSYIMPRGKRNVSSSGATVFYYVCNRSISVKYRSNISCTDNQTRSDKSRGSCKMKHACISQMTVRLEEDGTAYLKRCQTHYGHEMELQHLAVLEQDQMSEVSKMNTWSVQNDCNYYMVQRMLDVKCCSSICKSCDICVHMFSCTCSDYIIKNTICKHIHFVVNSNVIKNVSSQTNREYELAIESKNVLPTSLKTAPPLVNITQQDIKEDLLALHDKVSSVNFNKLSHQVVKNINSHIKIIYNLLNIEITESQSAGNNSKRVAGKHCNKIFRKQHELHSTQEKKKQKIRHKKPDKLKFESQLKDVLKGEEMYISHSSSLDHSYC